MQKMLIDYLYEFFKTKEEDMDPVGLKPDNFCNIYIKYYSNDFFNQDQPLSLNKLRLKSLKSSFSLNSFNNYFHCLLDTCNR